MTDRVAYRSLVSDNARWDGFAFRDGDIVISTPPKCGTTWTQMICALLIFRKPHFDKPLDQISPWLDMTTRTVESVVTDLEAQTHRRFIKTHTPLDGLPFDERVTYICVGRDLRDVAISEAHHFDNTDMDAFIAQVDSAVGLVSLADVMPAEVPSLPTSLRDRFWLWADGIEMPGQSISGLKPSLHHLQTFWNKRGLANVVVLHYDDLKDDLSGQMRYLASRLGIEIDEPEARDLARAATFESMRGRARDVAPNATETIWRDTAKFFHSGTSGQWRNVLTDEDLRRYAARVAELAPADLVEWIHRGPVVP